MLTVQKAHAWIALPIGAKLDADPADPKIAALLTDGYLALAEPVEPAEPASEPPPVE